MDSRPHQCDHEPAAQLPDYGEWLFSPDLSNHHPDFMFGSCGCSRRVAVTGLGIAAKHKENAAIELRDEYLLLPGRIADLPVNEPKPCN